VRLRRSHLTHLLNALYDAGETTVAVTHPCPEIGDLLTIDLTDPSETVVTFDQGALTYGDARDEVHRVHGQQAYDDLPDANAYVRALVASGLVDVENADEIATFVRRYGYPDLDAGHHPVALGLDANIMPWRLPDVLELDPQTYTDDQGRSAINGYALASGVYEELDWHYKHYDTRSLEDAFGPEFARLDDQPAGENREGFLGLFEYRRLRDQRYADTVECDRGDEAIVEAYREYNETGRKDILLLSNDHGFVDRAHDAGIHAQHVAFPIDVPESTVVSWDDLSHTLYTLAVVFGVLRLPKVTLYGAWNGKTGEDWRERQLEVDCRSAGIERALRRDAAITDAYTRHS
jgi:hypothetical protein